MPACPSCGEPNAERAKFCSECGAALTASRGVERRLVTALFCDLVGSTSLGERLDPESLKRVLERYFAAMRDAVERHGGSVDKYIGDAVVGRFGVPLAHEDDAVRAARAALEMLAALPAVNADLAGLGVELRVRIGIESGEVVVDPEAAQVATVGGDAFNTAARLQGAAPPGGVLVGERAARLLEGWAVLDPVAPLELKGKSEAVRALLLRSVDEVRRRAARTPFVGRARQLETLRRVFEDVELDGAGFLVTVIGAPGIGKTRLAEELAAELAERATVLVGYTPAYGEGIAFAPVADIVRTASGSQTADLGDVVTGLRALVHGRPDSTPIVERLAGLFGGETPLVGGETPWALRRLLECLATERPVVAMIEDVHLASEALMDLLDDVADRVRGAVLLLCSARPELLELRPSWGGGKARALTISLGPLSDPDAEGLASFLLADGSKEAVRRLTAAAEGNPFYLEQLAASLAEGEPSGDLAPPSVQALLAARLDRLEPAESRVLALASIEGRRFRPAVVEALDPEIGAGPLADSLDRLERRGLLAPLDEDDVRWFAHALIHEVTYRRIPKEARADLHARAADLLPRLGAEPDEVLGWHLERAARLRAEIGLHDETTRTLERRAGEHLAVAGAQAFAHLDLTTSSDLFERAAGLLPPGSPARLAMLPDLGVALMEVGRADDAETLLRDASREAEATGSEVDGLRIRIQLLALHVYRASPDEQVERAIAECLDLIRRLEAIGDDVGLAQGWVVVEYLRFVRGFLGESTEDALRAVRHAEDAGRAREQVQAGGDAGSYLHVGPSSIPEMEVRSKRLIDSGNPMLRVSGLAVAANAAVLRGDLEGFDRLDRTRREACEALGLEWTSGYQTGWQASSLLEAGEPERAERAIREAVETMERLGDVWIVASAGWLHARLACERGRLEEATRLYERLEERRTMDRESRIDREIVRSHLLAFRGQPAEAEAAARDAVALAMDSDMLLHQTASLERLADLLETAGRAEEARDPLREALAIHEHKGNPHGIARVRARLD